MLFIGDIHITAKYKDQIIDQIQQFIDQHPEENNIIFMGDYVYHFSYDRKSLLELFGLFVKLMQQAKNVYVLAGNHDWIAEHFVYEEAKQAFDLLQNSSFSLNGNLRFITTPELATIENQDILFFPYNTSLISDRKGSIDSIGVTIDGLIGQGDKNSQASGHVNALLHQQLSLNPKLIVIHHYYIANTPFPGQKSQFNYKDVALSPDFLDAFPQAIFVSGHLHKAFSYKNYLCVGSMRNTSPLETNQAKFFFTFDAANKKIFAQSVQINPYITMYENQLTQEHINEEFLHKILSENYKENIKCLESGNFEVEHSLLPPLDLKILQVMVYHSTLQYSNLESIFSHDILQQIKDIKIKNYSQLNTDILEKLDLSGKDLQNSFTDWKLLLQDYLKLKFDTQSPAYLDLLRQLKIL